MGVHPTLADLTVLLEAVKLDKSPQLVLSYVTVTMDSMGPLEAQGGLGELVALLEDAAWAAVELGPSAYEGVKEAVDAIKLTG